MEPLAIARLTGGKFWLKNQTLLKGQLSWFWHLNRAWSTGSNLTVCSTVWSPSTEWPWARRVWLSGVCHCMESDSSATLIAAWCCRRRALNTESDCVLKGQCHEIFWLCATDPKLAGHWNYMLDTQYSWKNSLGRNEFIYGTISCKRTTSKAVKTHCLR